MVSNAASVIIGEPLEMVKSEGKDCEPLYWGTKFSCQERKKIREISKRLQCNPNYLTSAIALETGGKFDPSIVNPLGYTGLIQIGSLAATDINRRKKTSITAGRGGTLSKMSVLEQLTYVEYYLEPYKGKLNTLADFYLAILMPIDCGKGNQRNHIVFDKNIQLDYNSKGEVIKNTKWIRQRAYEQNPVFHKESSEKEGKTYVWEIAEEIENWYEKGEKEQHSCEKNCPFKSSANNDGDKWHDPVINPISTNFYQNSNFDSTSKIWGLFGNDIRKEVSRKHTGLDLFAKTGTNIYACVDGTVYNRRWHTGYGNTITIKVEDPKSFMARKNKTYSHKTTREMEAGKLWDDSGDIYLFYAHLDTVNELNFGDEVKCGDILGTTGRSGVSAGTHAPHLHFEIFCSYKMAVGTKYRINPAYFVDYKFYDEQNDDDRNA